MSVKVAKMSVGSPMIIMKRKMVKNPWHLQGQAKIKTRLVSGASRAAKVASILSRGRPRVDRPHPVLAGNTVFVLDISVEPHLRELNCNVNRHSSSRIVMHSFEYSVFDFSKMIFKAMLANQNVYTSLVKDCPLAFELDKSVFTIN